MEKMVMKNFNFNPQTIDWQSSQSDLIYSPSQLSKKTQSEVLTKLPYFPHHIYVFSSSLDKIIILSKEALLISAKAVNKHLGCTSKDIWVIPLPLFHISGLSVIARSFIGSYSYVTTEGKWSAENFVSCLKEKHGTLSSLVPSQVYDLVRAKLKPPKSLRAVIVGGDRLDPELYFKARELNWPCLPSYGLTEAGSQVATASLLSLQKNSYPKLEILKHCEIKIQNKQLALKSKSLFSYYFHIKTKELNKQNQGWWVTEDMAELTEQGLIIKGRLKNQIKILGELVLLEELSEKLSSILYDKNIKEEYLLCPIKDQRKGYDIALVTTSCNSKQNTLISSLFNKRVRGFEKITKIYLLPKIDKNLINKKNIKKIYAQIGL